MNKYLSNYIDPDDHDIQMGQKPIYKWYQSIMDRLLN